VEDQTKVDFLQEVSTNNKLLRQLNARQTTSSKTLDFTSLTYFSTAIQGKGMNVNMMVDQKKLILTKLFKG
jgi:hypothetical protein